MIEVAAQRLRAQLLAGELAPSPVDVVRVLGAVQAQDYSGAKWALGQRCVATTDAEIERLFNEGRILRTHVLRPTWHFVLPEDSRWLLELTGPRVRRTLAGRSRWLEIDERVIQQVIELMCAALSGGHFLTRAQLGEVLHAAGIALDGQRVGHVVMAAELDGAIISGPRRSKQVTYALLSERAPGARRLDREEARAELVRRFFRSHGPAQIKDFTWWSGLTITDTRAGLALAGADLQRCDCGGNEYWFDPGLAADVTPQPVAHLLPNWDELIVAYRDRTAAHPGGPELETDAFPFGILSNVITIGGRVRGSWRRVSTGHGTRLELHLLDRLTPAERDALVDAGRRLSAFLQAPVELAWP